MFRIFRLLSTFLFCALLSVARAEPVINGNPTPPAKDFPIVEITGTVTDFFEDEYDQNYRFVILKTNATKSAYAVTRNPAIDFSGLIGAAAKIRGKLDRKPSPTRRYLCSTIYIPTTNDITVLTSGPCDPYDVAEISEEYKWAEDPATIASYGLRRMRGHVLAGWQGQRALIERSDSHEVSRMDISNQALPQFGAFIEAIGNVETDLSCLNFSRARWRPLKDDAWSAPAPLSVSAQDLYRYEGKSAINRTFHGKTIRLTGHVLSNVEGGRFQMDCNGKTVVIDASSNPEVSPLVKVGSKIAASGICVIDIDNWRPNEPFPRARGLFVVLRTADDIVILTNAPWWTVARLLSIIGALALAVLLISVWCALLRRLAERRGRELFRRQIAQAQSELKLEERTRLAVELHDSLAQNLSGVALEIEVSQQLSESAPSEAARHLDIAARALDSSRDELRNCLWDLRSNALEETDMAAAVTRTLLPNCQGVRLHVRFDIHRSRLSDNTTHALLRIIRELAINGIRHGKAKDIHVAGTIDKGWLRFSVRDNGSGFDVTTAPGVNEGHFGIQGIRERLSALGGDLTIESEIGSGTKAMGRIPVPTAENDEDHK